jgi:choline monooxygenase
VSNIERGDFSLRPIRLETWESFIFVNFDDSAPHLLPWLGDLPGKLAKYRLSELVVTRRKSYTIPCNWKFYVDNTVEPYHVPAVHGGTIQNVGPRNAWRFDANDGSYIILYGLFPGSLSLLRGDTGFPPIQGMSLDREERHDLHAYAEIHSGALFFVGAQPAPFCQLRPRPVVGGDYFRRYSQSIE